MCGGSVVCVKHGLLLVRVGANRESAMRGARGFLISYFSIFFATQISSLSIISVLPFLFASLGISLLDW